MKKRFFFSLVPVLICALFFICEGVNAAGPENAENREALSLNDILDLVEKRYDGAGFSARFEQWSTIKMLDITDFASGRMVVKRPGKMRWHYEEPEEQLIITDGISLWIYKPLDHQVMVGSFPAFFGDGKGASFLSDMKQVREKFRITLESGANPDGYGYQLRLDPGEKSYEISSIHLLISPDNFDVTRIVTHNADGDETRIDLKEIQFQDRLPSSLFFFDITDGLDVLQLDEP